MTEEIAQALALLVAQNLKVGIVGKALAYSSLAYGIFPSNREVNEVHAYACLLSGKPEEAKQVVEAWQAGGKEATHNLLVVKQHAELRLGQTEAAAATLAALLELSLSPQSGSPQSGSPQSDSPQSGSPVSDRTETEQVAAP